MVSDNREDVIQFIMIGLKKKSLDNIFSALEMHCNGYVQHAVSH